MANIQIKCSIVIQGNLETLEDYIIKILNKLSMKEPRFLVFKNPFIFAVQTKNNNKKKKIRWKV